jgi:hypothetical protein
MLNEVSRELNLRRIVFPKLITQGRLSKEEASERMDRLNEIAALLRHLQQLGITQSTDLIRVHQYSTPIHIKGGAQ